MKLSWIQDQFVDVWLKANQSESIYGSTGQGVWCTTSARSLLSQREDESVNRVPLSRTAYTDVLEQRLYNRQDVDLEPQ
jgi:hypothetical protein